MLKLTTHYGFHELFHNLFVMVFFQAINGLIMSSILKYASNITRLFIISCSTLITAVLSVIVFQTSLNFYFVLSALLVCVSIYLYYMK
jgi:probable UDP-sugar transporter A4